MIVGVQIVDLQEIVIDILDADLRPYAVEAKRLQGQHDEGAGGVLRERLVDLERDRRARAQRTIDEVSCDQLLGNVQRHRIRSRKRRRPSALPVQTAEQV